MGIIRVSDLDGNNHELEAVEGWRVMEVIRDHGLPIEALCGGACACATCHVRVDPAWANRLAPVRDEEEDMLDRVPGAAPTSRLSCQIIWDAHLDGLQLTLVGDAP